MIFLGKRLRDGWVYFTSVAPLVPVALACVAGAAWAESGGWAAFFLALAMVVARPRWGWWGAVVVIALTVAWRLEVMEAPVRVSLAEPRSEFVSGVLTVGRQVSALGAERYGTLVTDDWERRVVVVQALSYRPGQVLEIEGKFFVPPRERNPRTYSRHDFWKRAGVFGGLVLYEVDEKGWCGTLAPLRWAESLRDVIREGATRGLGEDSPGLQVIQASVLGEKPPRDSEVSRAFRESGAMHVFAVSGLHVTLVGSLFWLLLANTPVSRRVGLFVVILGMVSYAMVTGARPPAIRATVMAICFLGAFFLRRRPSLFNALALSVALVLCWRPSQVHELGFQLSYGVLLAIALGVNLTLKFTGRIAELDPFFPSRLLSDGQRKVLKGRRFFAELSASSLAAWAGSFPLMLWHFGVVTPVAVLASLLLIPATWAILGLAFLSVVLGLLSPALSVAVNQVNGVIGKGSYHFAKACSQVPGGHWQSRRMAPADWVAFDCHNGGAASFLDVDGGAMVDVGSEHFYGGELRSILDNWNVAVQTVFLTHPDGDHVGGLPNLLKREEGGGGLGKVVLPVARARSPRYREFMAQVEGAGCQKIVATTGQRYELDDEVWVEIIREGEPDNHQIADNRIMVMRVHWKGWRVLVTGDLGMADELALVEAGVDLEADVVIMGQHEWGGAGQLVFLEATGARVVIASAGDVPRFHFPKKRWAQLLRSEGYALFNQWESGAVMMDFDHDELRVWSFLQPEEELRIQR